LGYLPDQTQKRSLDHEVQKFIKVFTKLKLQDGILYHSCLVNGEAKNQLVLSKTAQYTIFKALHDDLGHQGRDRTLSLFRDRFYWPGMVKNVTQWVKGCNRCIRRKTIPQRATGFVNICSSYKMELVCIDYLSLEMSKGGFENVLVITDHFSRYAQAIPTKNQTARTTAHALFHNYFVHYGFPEKLHSDRGQNFLSKVIQRLCKIAGIRRTHTTPYHPQGNGQCERFNQTLLQMLGTLPNERKSDWKSAIPSLVHAYNCTMHELSPV